MNPNLFLSPWFMYSVGAAAGYDTCQFNEAFYAIHHDVWSKYVEWNNMNTIP